MFWWEINLKSNYGWINLKSTKKRIEFVLSNAYSEPSQIWKMERFAKMVKNVNYFWKKHHLRCLTRFLIRLYLSRFFFSIIVNWNYHFEPFELLSNVISDHQANTVGKDIDPVTSLRLKQKDGSKNLIRRRGEGKYVGNDYCLN